MAYSAAQLRAMYAAEHFGLFPDATTGAALDLAASRNASGALTDEQTRAAVVNTGDGDTAVAALSYQFFTGSAPSAAGMQYLVNSNLNSTDLSDAYYSRFSSDNRYINFAINLGVMGAGAATFSTTYGSLTFAAAVAAAYDTVIGPQYVESQRLNAFAAKGDIVSRLAYFTAVARASLPANATAAQLDLGIKAAMVGYLMSEAMKADVGVYASAMNNFSNAIIDGRATYGGSLTAYASPASSLTPVGGTSPTAPGTPTAPDLGPTVINLPGSDQTWNSQADNRDFTVNGAAGAFNYTITLGNGANTVNLAGTTGNDKVTTGTGNDLLVYGANLTAADLINAGTGVNTLRVSGAVADVAFGGITAGTIQTLDYSATGSAVLAAAAKAAGIVTLTNSGNGGITVTATDAAYNATTTSFTGGTGNDTFNMGTNLAAVDTVNGGTGTNTLTFTDGNGAATDMDKVTNIQTVTLGNAATVITLLDATTAAAATLTINGAALAAVTLDINGSAEADGKLAITTGAGGTSAIALTTAALTAAATGIVGGAGDDTLTGAAGNDVLIGNAGIDTIATNGGADTVVGGAGADAITGGGGVDSIAYIALAAGISAEAGDSITAFTRADDKLVFSSDATHYKIGNADAVVDNITTKAAIADAATANAELIIITTAATTTGTGAADIATITASVTAGNGVLVVIENSTTGAGEVWFDSNGLTAGGITKIATLVGINQAGVDAFDGTEFTFIG